MEEGKQPLGVRTGPAVGEALNEADGIGTGPARHGGAAHGAGAGSTATGKPFRNAMPASGSITR